MKIGYCIGLGKIQQLDDYGLDYFETAIAPLAMMSEEEFAEKKAFLKTLKTPVETGNMLLPGELKIVGPKYSVERIQEYLEVAFSRAKEIGMELLVFGSGNAKKIPDGFDRDEAMKQLGEFMHILAETAEKYQIVTAVEALRKAECNCINSLDEAEGLCDIADSEYVVMLADWYHMQEEGETAARMEALGKRMHHVHIARPQTRAVPCIGDEFDYTEFFAALERMGYDARISAEGNSKDDEYDCKQYIAFMHRHLS